MRRIVRGTFLLITVALLALGTVATQESTAVHHIATNDPGPNTAVRP